MTAAPVPPERPSTGGLRSPGAARAAFPAALPAASRVASLLLAAALLAACSGSASPTPTPTATAAATPTPTAAATPTPTPAAFPATLTDDEGGSVVLPAEPMKLVSLTPAVTETLFALGLGDRIVGNDDFDDYPEAASRITHVASYTGVDVEKIVGLAPDLVIAGGQGFTDPAAVTKLRSLGIPVLVLYAPDVPGVLADIELLGRAVGRAEAATAMAAAMRAGIADISAAAAAIAGSGGARPRVFYELDATKEIYGPADDSFVASMIELAGGTPITTGSPSVYSITLEKLVAADPEVIVLGDANYGVTPADVEARSGWKGMTAVKAGAIRPVDDTIVTRPGPRLVQGLVALALAIHPEAQLPPAPSFPAVP